MNINHSSRTLSDPSPYNGTRGTSVEQFILRYRTWTSYVEKMNEIHRGINSTRLRDPALADHFKQLADNGKKIKKLFGDAYESGRNRDGFTFIEMKLKKLNATDWEVMNAKEQYDKGWQRGPRTNNYRPNRPAQPGLQKPAFNPRHNPFKLRNLNPSSEWMVMMDETGESFDVNGVIKSSGNSQDSGKLVSLLIPKDCTLPKLNQGVHAVDEIGFRHSEIRLGEIFKATPHCGILGVTLEGMTPIHAASMDYWYTAIERSFDLILRLLPLSEQGNTRIHMYVEARCETSNLENQNQKVRRALDASLYRLAKADPDRENRIRADVVVEMKKDRDASEIFKNFNGYVDTIANAWNGLSGELHADLDLYGLPGNCLLRGSVQNLSDVMDSVDAGIPIDPPQWSALVDLAAKNGPDSIPAAVLDRVAKQIRKDRKLRWFPSLVAEVQSRLDSRDVRLRSISAQAEWLRKNAPRDAELPERLRLLWQTIQLSEANHRGLTEKQLAQDGVSMDEFRSLAKELYSEDAPLSTWAMLHLAVQKTDAFQFEEARMLLRDFVSDNLFGSLPCFRTFPDQKNETICAGPGLRNYGKILSSLGQHEAFLGRPESAVPFFEKALECFARLSENKDRDIEKTHAYLCTALMDDPNSDATKRRDTLEAYLGGNIREKGMELAISSDPKSAYPHHILLRYFMSGHATAAEKSGYLSQQEKWAFLEDGHPWEMIAFYRAMLVSDYATQKDWLTRAANIAVREGGGTLQAISAVIHGALLQCANDHDGLYRQGLENALEVVRREIGDAFGEERYNALRNQLDPARRRDPLSLARDVLPFNFR